MPCSLMLSSETRSPKDKELNDADLSCVRGPVVQQGAG